ncbi:GNAT family N-acetyltransferase [Microbispora sp. GKU 823]|uniref:GNAT family N-acetyltransferase n=1 Tax=Microbispora sp. GKU 823 TaxID=1652100 RepID=UPI0009A4196F|nr:GNAT family N-acetyltransferase [Microbispora sp. GKU 823]OPG12512.1 GNAT family N-acetyltransferase [Microbispora sp. GKU 823]
MIELRVLNEDDWPIWREVRLAALAEAPDAFGSTLSEWQGEGDREERWRGRLAIPGSHNVIAVIDDRPVGMVSGVPAETADEVELISLWVSPMVRGAGVGGRLIREVERWAVMDRAARTLRLSVMPDNGRAIALYERYGFEDTGEPGDLLRDGVDRKQVLAKALRDGAGNRH